MLGTPRSRAFGLFAFHWCFFTSWQQKYSSRSKSCDKILFMVYPGVHLRFALMKMEEKAVNRALNKE